MSNTSSVGILETFSSAVESVAETVSPSVVSVSSDGRNGTGVVWDDQGHIVTAYHVVQGLEEVEVGSNSGETFTAKVVGRDSTSDLALLKVEAKLSPIAKGDSESLRVGQFVLALANPYATKASATSGIITSVKRSIGGWWGAGIEDAVVTDARLNPGYSGGPLVDASGRMVALNIAYMSSRGIAVPIKKVSATVERLASGKVSRTRLSGDSHPPNSRSLKTWQRAPRIGQESRPDRPVGRGRERCEGRRASRSATWCSGSTGAQSPGSTT